MKSTSTGKPMRAFRGVWIDREIWLNTDLTIHEKVLLAEIDSLSTEEKGCYARNTYFATFFKLSRERVKVIIRNLIQKGYLESEIDQASGNERWLRCIWQGRVQNDPSLGSQTTLGLGTKVPEGRVQNDPSLYKEDNKVDNIDICVRNFVEYWNTKNYLTKIKAFGSHRIDQLLAMLSEEAFKTNWKLIIDKLDASKYHTGRMAGSTWTAGVDWLLKSENYPKILELEDGSSAKTIDKQKTEAAIEARRKQQIRDNNEAYLSNHSIEQLRALRGQQRFAHCVWLIDELITKKSGQIKTA